MRRRKNGSSGKTGAGQNCPKCSAPMDRRRHTASWRPKAGQPFYYEFWDYCSGCGHLQHYDQAKVWIDLPTDRRVDDGPPDPNPDSSIGVARRRVREAVNAHLGLRCNRSLLRAFISTTLGIDLHYAGLNLLDEIECQSVLDRIADMKKPAEGRSAG